MNPEDSGRKVTCKINGTQVEDAELYYCPERDRYFILQNEKGGGIPQSLSQEEKGYKYSWCYFDPSDNYISPDVTEFEFKEEASICVVSDNRYQVLNTETPTISFKHYEIDFDEVRTIQDIKDVLKALNITIIGSYADQIKHLLKEKK